jgi:GH15 family glucan-1,4-alpha-glucosidase
LRNYPDKLRQHIDILLEHKTEEGGFLASKDYEPYRKVWLRDHAHIALSLLRAGEIQAAREASNFSLKILERERGKFLRIVKIPKDSEDFFNEENHIRARYWPDLRYVESPWNERQYDGLALNLAFLSEFSMVTNSPLPEETINPAIFYLLYVFDTPCADLWEMHENFIHSETLGAIYYGLSKIRKFTSLEVDGTLNRIKGMILKNIRDGVLKKMCKGDETLGIDSSVLLLFGEFNVFSPIMENERIIVEKTLDKIYQVLSPDGVGLRRFWILEWGERGKDTYFGGGVWCITTLWAGEVYLKLGKREKVIETLEYFNEFPLPEQRPEVFNEKMLEFWRDKTKGETGGIPGPANPLAWSHATWIDLFLKFRKS